MANTNAAFGLKPVRLLGGGIPQRNETYTIASAYGTALYRGDPVKTTGTSKRVQAAAAGDVMVGAFGGCSYTAADGSVVYSNYWPAAAVATNVIAYVYDDPDTLFEIQANGVGLAAGDIGQCANLVAGTGSAATGNSGWQLDASTIANGGDIGVKIYELVNRPDNAYGTYAKALVLINEHELRPGTLTGV